MSQSELPATRMPIHQPRTLRDWLWAWIDSFVRAIFGPNDDGGDANQSH